MNLRSVKTIVLGGMALLVATLPITQIAQVSASTICSPVNGQWYLRGNPGPIITQSGDLLTVDMSAYGRPTATGRILSPTQIQVTFPDDGTFVGTLNGRGQINWNNSTVWQALSFAGTWQYEGRPGPVITQSGRRLTVDMSAYRRPTAVGRVTTPGNASVRFPDDATLNATLVSPSCIRWTDSTTWTK
ncbi:hypothetical protein H0901_16820 [Microcystis aeruginosa BLCCF158]|uniref:Uncharacterized protein n=1 Tax=Microcystis aeruginosa BLCC-F158 TaxID=2755316 RepID=A0A841V7T0_MICAE|nr:hypothetical protein [Microcystis aeruginosa]MBC1196867.1 hypothetical protein [Microcystis aeruginosa BLCC-F158]